MTNCLECTSFTVCTKCGNEYKLNINGKLGCTITCGANGWYEN